MTGVAFRYALLDSPVDNNFYRFRHILKAEPIDKLNQTHFECQFSQDLVSKAG
jgi:hypothetical protein